MSQDRRLSFDSVAALYQRARPTYPAELFEDLAEICQIGKDSSIVEVGCGTGQASIPLASMCDTLTCVELGPNLAAAAAVNLADFGNAKVICSSFEEWNASGEAYDLIFSATAWHWLDPIRRYEKAHEALRPGGCLAVVKNQHAFPKDLDPFFEDLNCAYEQIAENRPDLGWPRPLPDEIPDDREEMVKTGHFEFVTAKRYLWQVDYTGDQFVDLLSTYSDHIAMPKEKSDFLYSEVRRHAVKRPGGLIHKVYLSILQMARAT